ncbi:MAG: hypothetical protein Solivirus3_2 [Solivirus sp.]|uniref:Uncharacterized protein n=1 Tax=Solivirus sp. TaxID=2487772 RepID=A0A3G5AFP9_9VIRU|nr:MAG: hypothetical protein Solivirus3_2 [Solivirus sp.]
MVNTFLLDEDFRRSASKLNSQRLGKQRVEAQQILTILENLSILAQLFNIPSLPQETYLPREMRAEWIKVVVTCFKNTKVSAIRYSSCGKIEALYSKSSFPRKIASNETLYLGTDGIFYLYKSNQCIASGNSSQFLLPGDRLITSSYMNHPIITAWLGYNNALKYYINCHIDEWISRGFQNTMCKHEIKEAIAKPFWSCLQMIKNHQSTLLERELERKEKYWYLHQREFIESWIEDPVRIAQFYAILATGNFTQETLLQYGKFHGFIWP